MKNELMLFPKAKEQELSKNFSLSEFRCKCDYQTCHFTLVHELLIIKLQKLRGYWGSPIKITSGYRCQRHNEDVGGVARSFHTVGYAADLQVDFDLDSFEKAVKNFFKFYIRYENFIHVDIRLEKELA